MKEGGAVGRPPLLDGSNYSYWKARMKAFIKALDERAWRSVLSGWTPPTTTDTEGKTIPKPELEWTSEEDKLASYNSKALNAIFNAVDPTQFKQISTCESAKVAWEILQTAFEGTSSVRLSRLQILTTRFETLKISEDI